MQFVGFDVYVLGREASGFECGEKSRADVSEWQVSHLNHFNSQSHSIIGYSLLYIYISSSSRVKEYLPIVGLADFNKLSAKLIFGADR